MTAPYEEDDMDPHAGFREETDDHASLRGRLEALLPNVLRKTVSGGVGARQMTEEVVRNALGDMKLPKEAVTYLVELADNTKKEVVRVAAREFREFLESARFNEELARILTQLSFEIRTEIRFVPNDDRLRPSVSSRAHLNTGGSSAGGEELAAAEGINDAIRTGAQDIAEMMLSRVLRQREEDGTPAKPTSSDTSPAPHDPEEPPEAEDSPDNAKPAAKKAAPAKKPRAPRKRATRSGASEKAGTRKKASEDD